MPLLSAMLFQVLGIPRSPILQISREGSYYTSRELPWGVIETLTAGNSKCCSSIEKAVNSIWGVKGAFLEEVAFAPEGCKSLQIEKEGHLRRAWLAWRRVRRLESRVMAGGN